MLADKTMPQVEKVMLDIVIPPCPATLTAVMREANSPTVDFANLATLISHDAGLVGPLLKLANSPLIGLSKKVSSVFQALSVLGMQTTLNLVQNISVRQSIKDGSSNFESFWERSTLEAQLAEKIARKLPGIQSSDAYLATLFHDCGIPILMMKFPKYPEVMKTQTRLGICLSKAEDEIFYTNHAAIGNLLTRNWMLPSQISQAILHHHDVSIFQHEEQSQICDLIGVMHMAQYIADVHLNAEPKEWYRFEHAVLKHFGLSTQEFLEMKNDFLAYLNDE